MYLYCVNLSGRMVIFAQFPLKCSFSPFWLLFVLKQVNDIHSGVLNPQQDKHLVPDKYRFLDPIPNLVQQKGDRNLPHVQALQGIPGLTPSREPPTNALLTQLISL